ncbi:hypothetical protein EG329_005364 [Mollisiaceae sp. DMI_Dod_QoI]|nr:hypothetical protein EG329_005364 [Helotiales sp. DMI_Dod_QoI]
MAESSQSQRPRLEHRQSQTIIDLTEDDEVPAPSWDDQARPLVSMPPQLGRSDAVSLGDFVDLTEDNGGPDIIFTGERQLPAPPPNPVRRPPPRRDQSPPLFVPDRPRHGHINRVFATPHAIGYITGAIQNAAARSLIGQSLFAEHMHILHHDHVQAMPGAMNYQHAAFAERKPDHIAPPAVPRGFTRSPTDTDLVICPSCEEELVHHKDAEEPVLKKGGKAPSRKDMEEHPFWVVKECGHVYCNKCYQLRQTVAKNPSLKFREVERKTSRKGPKVITCAVEDCNSDVKSKEKWVGVFL